MEKRLLFVMLAHLFIATGYCCTENEESAGPYIFPQDEPQNKCVGETGWHTTTIEVPCDQMTDITANDIMVVNTNLPEVVFRGWESAVGYTSHWRLANFSTIKSQNEQGLFTCVIDHTMTMQTLKFGDEFKIHVKLHLNNTSFQSNARKWFIVKECTPSETFEPVTNPSTSPDNNLIQTESVPPDQSYNCQSELHDIRKRLDEIAWNTTIMGFAIKRLDEKENAWKTNITTITMGLAIILFILCRDILLKLIKSRYDKVQLWRRGTPEAGYQRPEHQDQIQAMFHPVMT